MNPLRVLDLFSGIGGFSLGLERAGMTTVAFCERDGYACRVLRKHWPAVPIFEDITTLTKTRLRHHGIEADVLCGGFPCQDISTAGKGAGLDGARSGLWREFARLIREVRPRYAVLENVAALRSRGLDRVLGDLAAIGYDAEWHCIPAAAVGAPQRRDRVWIVAHPFEARFQTTPSGRAESVEDYGPGPRLVFGAGIGRPGRQSWPDEPCLCRVVDGIPHRVDRFGVLGNAVVPQVVELIGRAIVADHRRATAPGAVAA